MQKNNQAKLAQKEISSEWKNTLRADYIYEDSAKVKFL